MRKYTIKFVDKQFFINILNFTPIEEPRGLHLDDLYIIAKDANDAAELLYEELIELKLQEHESIQVYIS